MRWTIAAISGITLVIGAVAVYLLFLRREDAPPGTPSRRQQAPADAHPAAVVPPEAPVAVSAPDPTRWPRSALADYDPRHVDPLVWLPRITAEVAKVMPDAVVYAFIAESVDADGISDLTVPNLGGSLAGLGSVQVNLARATAVGARAGAPCSYLVVLDKDGIRGMPSAYDKPEECGHPPRKPPRCKIKDVLARFAGRHPPSGRRTDRVSFFDGRWVIVGFYQRLPDGSEERIPHRMVAGGEEIADDCAL